MRNKSFKFLNMFSYERQRTSPYSEDLRWRIVWQKEALGLKTSEVAARLGVDPRTVRRITRKFKLTGCITKKHPVCSHPLRKLSSPVQFNIANLILQRQGIYLHEIQHQILQDHGEQISASSICRFLQKSGFTRQK